MNNRGFSFVYLAKDDKNDMYAIKTIRCKMGKEVADNARKEAIITNRFQHKNIIKIVVNMASSTTVKQDTK
jgi:serine/threonine kinase 16